MVAFVSPIGVNAETKKAICLSVPKSPTQKLTGKKYEPPVEKYLDEGLQTDRVYFGIDVDTGEIVYAGKSSNLDLRQAQHYANGKTFEIVNISEYYGVPDYPNLTPHQARAIEQYYIDKFGMQKLDGLLQNKINSIAINRDIYPGTQQFAEDFINNYKLKN